MTVCGDCGGTVIEYDVAAGNGFCVSCGTVIEENTIVSEVTFGETSNGAAIVQGSYIGQGSTHARMGGPFGNRGSSESREQTIANASRKIRNVATVMRLSDIVSAAAVRMYTLAVEHRFTKGRRNMNVIAVCLYVACRQKETRNYMLIDFSDLLQVNVFELGHTYLQLVQVLNLRLPLVDPSHYISRFAALLEFGDETPKVAADAVRLVSRMDRDWMSRGRRPAGICGACLLLAARMNNFRRSVQEIVQVVKIADTTLQKRLDEFKKTPSGQLTLADFRTVWLEEEMDPPAYTKGKEKEAKEFRDKEREAMGSTLVEDEEAPENRGKKGKKRGRKRKRADSGNWNEVTENRPGELNVDGQNSSRQPSQALNPRLLNEGILAGAVDAPLFLPFDDHLDRNSAASRFEGTEPAPFPQSSQVPVLDPTLNGLASQTTPLEVTADAALIKEVNDFLTNPQGSMLVEALDEAEERRRQAHTTDVDELMGLNEEELDALILSEEEVKIKERVWVEINRDYLEALAVKGAQKEGLEPVKSRKRRKTSKPRDALTPHGSTAAESVRNLIKKNPKYSKRINYDALKDLFDHESSTILIQPNIDLDEKEDYMYHMSENEKSDGEGVSVVVEESGGGVGMPKSTNGSVIQADTSHADEGAGDTEAADEDAEGEEIELSDYGWDEGYQQEV